MNRPRDQFLAGPGFTQDQYRGVGGRHHLHLSHYAFYGRAGSDNFLEVLRITSEGLPFDILLPVALAQVGYERDPAERRQFQNGSGDQYRHARSVLADQFFFEGRASPEAQTLFVREFIQGYILLRRKIRPYQTAGPQILTAIADQVEKSVVGFRDAVKLSGNYAHDGGFGRYRTDAFPASPQFLIPLVTFTEVAHNSGITL